MTITGQVENRSSIEAVVWSFLFISKLDTQNSELVFTETFNIPAGGTHPFTVTATAGAEGTVTLTGKVTQNNSTLVEIADQYEVAKPNVSASVAVPDIVGNEPFQIKVEIKNTGKVDATIQFGVQSSEFGDSTDNNDTSGRNKTHSISTTNYAKYSLYLHLLGRFESDYNEDRSTYGLGATIQFGVGSSELGVFPEGNVAVPVTITNTGQLTETLK